MSSATSIDPSAGGRASRSGKVAARHSVTSESATAADPGLRPWQFFVLAGMLSATAVVIVATGQSPAAIVVLSLTVIAASLVALGAYRSLVPLVLPEAAAAPQLVGGRTRAALEREKTLVLRSIKDLEFDFAMKKVSQSDFDEMSGRLRARAMGLMRQLDAGASYRSSIEQELDKRLGRQVSPAGTGPAAPPADEVQLEAEAEAEEQDAGVVLCAGCAQENDGDARFCKQCGVRLSE